MTRQDKQKYLMNPGTCPFCGSNDVDGQAIDVDGDKVTQAVSCCCGAAWVDYYTLVDIEITHQPEEN